jgi:hypothetical protein
MGHVELDGTEAGLYPVAGPVLVVFEPITKEIWDF